VAILHLAGTLPRQFLVEVLANCSERLTQFLGFGA
jgi:hypothetical protein